MSKKTVQNGRYIDMNKLLGHQKSMYMILSDRGFGKTYGALRHIVNDFLKRGKKFIYVRRYKGEFKMISTLFDSVRHLYPDHKITVKGWNFYIDGKIFGMGMVLTRYQDYKGGAYPDYDNILFDEFLREKVKSVGYLNNDVEAFLSICDSVFRDREGVKAILLSNTVSEINPYFVDLKINRMNNSEYAYSQVEGIKENLVVYIRELDEEMQQKSMDRSTFRTMLGSVDKYRDVAIANKFGDDDSTFIERKSKQAEFYCALRLKGNVTYGVWVDYEKVKIYISKSYEKTTKEVYAFEKENHGKNTIFVDEWRKVYRLTRIVNAFKKKNLMFDSIEVKMGMFGLFSKLRIF